MLYDNAQLVVLYSQAYRAFGNRLHLQVVDDTLAFIEREWKSPSGLYFAALDADSDGVEGKYYVWTETELDEVLGEDSALIKKYFGVGSHGYWEHDVSVLCLKKKDEVWCREQKIEPDIWSEKLRRSKELLRAHRLKKTKPALDDKCIASWNCMLLKAFSEASKIEGRRVLLQQATSLAESLLKHLMLPNGLLAHVITKGRVAHVALLEDQVFFADALLALYEVIADEKWLKLAAKTMESVDTFFSNSNSAFYQNRSTEMEDVCGVKFEISDNVIPAGNSVACRCLLKLARHFENRKFSARASNMLREVSGSIDFVPGFSNWILALLEFHTDKVEVVFTGSNAIDDSHTFQKQFHPFVLVAASTFDSELPLFRHRPANESAIYVCKNQSCELPVYRVEDIRI